MSLEDKIKHNRTIISMLEEKKKETSHYDKQISSLQDKRAETILDRIAIRDRLKTNSTKYYIWFQIPPITGTIESGNFIAKSYHGVALTKENKLPVSITGNFATAYVKEDIAEEAICIKQITTGTLMEIVLDDHGFYVVIKLL